MRPKDWRTLLLAITIYSGWILATLFHTSIPTPLLIIAGGWLVAWHGSFQHEAIHGHPFYNREYNFLLACIPLSVFLPYQIYRHQHIDHHSVPTLTDPYEDPESFYITQKAWEDASSLKKSWLRVNNTLAGRLILGPALVLWTFFASEFRKMAAGDYKYWRAWAGHIALCIAMFLYLHAFCELSIIKYLLCFMYPGLSLTLLRSYAEHRPAASFGAQSVIVESEPIFELLYLGNNFHYLHHASPELAWYELRENYKEQRTKILETNDEYLFNGYREIARRHLFWMKDHPIHPDHTIDKENKSH